MVNFRLTRSQRAAATNQGGGGGTDTNRSLDDEAPYHQIETSINQIASASASTSASASEENSNGNNPSTPRRHPHRDPDLQSSRGRTGSGGPSSPGRKSATKRVLRLLDSPRRKILGKMNPNSAGSGPGSASASRRDPGSSSYGGRDGDSSVAAAAASSSSSSASCTASVPGAAADASPESLTPHCCHSNEGDEGDGGGKLKAAPSPIDVPPGRSGSSYPTQETKNSTNSLATPIRQAARDAATVPTSVAAKYSDPASILVWLHDDAPQDILPRVLSFAGSRKISTLSRTSKSWRTICLSETVWQTACEDTGKFRPGVDPPLRSDTTWLQHYRDNPLVPTDYDTIQAAFYKRHRSVTTGRPNWQRSDPSNRHPVVPEHDRSLRVLLKPKRYVLKEALVVHALGSAEVTIETVDGPAERANGGFGPLFNNNRGDGNNDEGRGVGGASALTRSSSERATSSTPTSTSTKRRLRELLSCRSATGAVGTGQGDEDGSVDEDDEDISDTLDLLSSPSYARNRAESLPNLPQDPDLYRDGCYPKYAKRRAVLVLKSKKQNEPMVRVRQGTLRLKDVDFVHNTTGNDIWNGNSAVQVQPPLDEDGHFAVETAAPNVTATAIVDSCNISSISGRGIVSIDGGLATVKDCHVHDCAATGIYVGGAGSAATIQGTDVLHNGYGNKRNPRRGVARGHSGVYLEQGTATLRDCNISSNALTGISAVSADNAMLDIRDSDLMANESIQLEMPPRGSISERRSISRDNRINPVGMGRSRSGLVPPEDVAVASPATQYSPEARTDRPQSPLSDGSESENPGWAANW
mmetsp:Transcript_23490/g.52047  ORF Transcript_23490/g.52047 Transcript_23490/m.52047 type:complete len:811 (-) Transcript_23490:168-2600(-)